MVKRLIVYSLPVAFMGLGIIASAAGLHIIEGTSYPNDLARVTNVPTKNDVFFPFVNYLGGESFINYYGSYSNLLRDFVYLFAASYLPSYPHTTWDKKTQRIEHIHLTGLCTSLP